MSNSVKIVWDKSQLTDYIEAGDLTMRRVYTILRKAANAGRTSARQLIASQFKRRTGRLHQQSRAIQTNVTAKPEKIQAVVGPIPNLMNIFEKGADIPARTMHLKKAKAFIFGPIREGFARGTLVAGHFHLRARPVMNPSLRVMEDAALAEIDAALDQPGGR
jgi:hypothetical protein